MAKTNAGIISIADTERSYQAEMMRIRQQLFDAQLNLEEHQTSLRELVGAAGTKGGGTNLLTITLVNDAGGIPGATVLQQWSTTAPADNGASTPLTTLVPLSTVNLLNGVQYWITATTTNGDTAGYWHLSTTATAFAVNTGSGWSAGSSGAPAFDVLAGAGTSAPEPSTFLTLGAGALLVLLRRVGRV